MRRDQVKTKRKIRRLKRKKGWVRSLAGRALQMGLSVAMLASLTLLGFTAYQYWHRAERLPGGDILPLGEIRVTGCAKATEAELLKMAGLDFGTSLLKLNLKEVSSHIAQHPWVEKAKVRRDWSRKALIIEVQEKVPRALILLDDLYLLDRQGALIKKATLRERADFPVLTGLKKPEVTGGNQQGTALVREALRLLEHLGERKMFTPGEVSEIHISKGQGLTIFTLREGIPIRLGSGDFRDKLDRLEKVLPDLRPKAAAVEYLDLQYPRKVVVKMKEPGKEKTHRS